MTEHGGIPVAIGATPGGQVTTPGQVQYGEMLLGSGTPAGWLELIGWRDAPEASAADTPRPQSHGAYPGSVLADAVVVTFRFLLRGTPENKAAALAAIERYAPMDGVERMLAVNDCDDGVWFRMGRLIGRNIPQGKHFTHAPVEGSLQFLCADPRRYSLTENTGTIGIPVAEGGLDYPLVYTLEYGTTTGGAAVVGTNEGAVDTPLVATFRGPLTNPVLHGPDWTMAFDITLVDGESLVVDTNEGTALLDGSTDRLYTIANLSDPLELCLMHPGTNTLSLTATDGNGVVDISFRDARM